MENEVPGVVSELIDEIVSEDAESIASQEIDIGMQHIKVGAHHKESNDCRCGCTSKIEDLQKELAHYKATVEMLPKQLDDHLAPFSEKRFVSDEYIKFYTGLLNFRLVVAVVYRQVLHFLNFNQQAHELLKVRKLSGSLRWSVSCFS